LISLFKDIEARYLALVQDLGKVNNRTNMALSKIGASIPIQGSKPSSVWSGLVSLMEAVTQNTINQ